MATATKKGARKAAAKKAPAKKAAAPTTKDKVLAIAKAAGSDGVDVKSLAAQAGVSQATANKAIKLLEDEGKVKRDGPGRVIAKGRLGRRSSEVVDRDNKILAFIAKAGDEGVALADIPDACDTNKRLAYETVWRLREQGLVSRVGSTRSARWVAAA